MAADQPSYVRAHVRGEELALEIDGPSAASARATVDDLLACLIAAEKTLGITTPRRSS